MTFTEAVQLAKAGDNRGFNYLYASTYKEKYYLALKYMKTDAAAQDVLQDAYIKAFGKLDTLQDPEKFSSWLGMIVTNKAKNELEKRNLLSLDAYMEGEDGETFERELEDENINNQPELAYTKQETQLLVHEMIDGLSEDQKMCILMFYMEKASIREIAEAMDCSENTVKSRLNYGRKNLKAKAEELQKKGYKLYSVAPVAFLLWLLQSEYTAMDAEGALLSAGRQVANGITHAMPQLANASAASAQNAYNSYQGQNNNPYGDYAGQNHDPYNNYQGQNGNPYGNYQGANGDPYGNPYGYQAGEAADAAAQAAYGSEAAGASGTAGTAAKTGIAAFVGTTTGKIVIGVAGVAVVAGLIGGGVALARRSADDSDDTGSRTIQIEQENEGTTGENGADTGTDNGQTENNPFEDGETVVSANSQEDTQETQTPLELAAEAFRVVVAEHANYRYAGDDMAEWENNSAHSYTYSYAFTEMTGDDVPELLLDKYDEDSGYDYIKIFYYDASSDSVLTAADTIQAGVAGVGGFRGGVSGSLSGKGLYESSWSSGTGAGSIYLYSISIGTDQLTLSHSFVEDFQIGSDTPSSTASDETTITWYAIDDTTGIDAFEAGTLNLNTQAAADASENTEENAEDSSGESDAGDTTTTLKADNVTIFEGTIRYLTADELLAIQGQPDPYYGIDTSSFRYVVLILDNSTTMTANSGDGSGTRSGTANMICLYSVESYGSSTYGSIPDDVAAHDGERAVVRFSAVTDLWWPSDASLPLGEPSGEPAEIQYIG